MNSSGVIARNREQRSDWITRWPGRIEQGAAILCQPDENVVFVGDGRVLNVVSSGRFIADAGPLPFLAPFIDPASRVVTATVFFVTVDRPFELSWSMPVEVRGSARAEVVAKATVKVFEPIALVGAMLKPTHAATSEDVVSALIEALTVEAAPELGPSLRAMSSDEVFRIVGTPEVVELTRAKAVEVMSRWGVCLTEGIVLTLRGTEATSGVGERPTPERLGRVMVSVPAGEGDPIGWFHQAGVPLLLVDRDALSGWSGGRPTERWLLRRHSRVAVEPWPKTETVFDRAEVALRAYELTRAHLRDKLPGATVRDSRAETTLLDPLGAHAETFAQSGSDVAWISLDRVTEALLLARATEMATGLSLQGCRAVSFRPVGDDASVALASHTESTATNILLYALPEPGDDPVEPLCTGRWVTETEPLTVDLPSGVALALWAAVSGEALAEALGVGLPAEIDKALGAAPFVALPTRWNGPAQGPVAMALRVHPGRWQARLYTQGSGAATARCLSLHHVDFPEWVPGQVSSTKTSMQDRFVEGGGDDPVFFPGERYETLSDIVGLMRRVKKGPRKECLESEGLDGESLGELLGRFAKELVKHPEHTKAFSRAMRNG